MDTTRRQFMAGMATFGAAAVIAPGELLRPPERVSLPDSAIVSQAAPEAAPGLVTMRLTALPSAAWDDVSPMHPFLIEIDGLRQYAHFGEPRPDIIPGIQIDVMGWQLHGALNEPCTLKVWGYLATLNPCLVNPQRVPLSVWSGRNPLSYVSQRHPLEISLPMGDLRLYPASLPAAL
jgi:hypothetical protein